VAEGTSIFGRDITHGERIGPNSAGVIIFFNVAVNFCSVKFHSEIDLYISSRPILHIRQPGICRHQGRPGAKNTKVGGSSNLQALHAITALDEARASVVATQTSTQHKFTSITNESGELSARTTFGG